MSRVDATALKAAVLAVIAEATQSPEINGIPFLGILLDLRVVSELRKTSPQVGPGRVVMDRFFLSSAIRSLRNAKKIRCAGRKWRIA